MNVYYDSRKKQWFTMNGRPCILASGDHIESMACDAGWLQAIPQGLVINGKLILEGENIKVKNASIVEDEVEGE